VTVEAKSWIEGTPHSWGWIDFLDARPLNASKRGRIASFLLRPAETTSGVRRGREIFCSHEGHGDIGLDTKAGYVQSVE
jgi:hypothetical protein